MKAGAPFASHDVEFMRKGVARLPLVCLLTTVSLAWVVQHPASIHSQEARPTFRTGVALVPITVVVRDSRNRMVTDLEQDDFHVLENSQPRKIVDFKATDNAPVSIALLFDTSGSMAGSNLARGRHIVDRLLGLMNRSSDDMALYTFDKTIRRETPFTNEPDVIRRALDSTRAFGQTSLYDAIAETAKQLGDLRSKRGAVVVITDGADTSSRLSPSEVSGIAGAIDVPVYVMAVVPPRRNGEKDSDREADLAQLAYWTGGGLSHAHASGEADGATAALMAELRQQYFLAIESATASGWYRLDVRTKRQGLTVRTRSGYFANPNRAKDSRSQSSARTSMTAHATPNASSSMVSGSESG